MITVESVEKKMNKKTNPAAGNQGANVKKAKNTKLITYGIIGVVAIGAGYFIVKKVLVKKPEMAPIEPAQFAQQPMMA